LAPRSLQGHGWLVRTAGPGAAAAAAAVVVVAAAAVAVAAVAAVVAAVAVESTGASWAASSFHSRSHGGPGGETGGVGAARNRSAAGEAGDRVRALESLATVNKVGRTLDGKLTGSWGYRKHLLSWRSRLHVHHGWLLVSLL
jgi:hypothetical protein